MSSWKATASALEARTGGPRNKVVLLILASRANHEFICIPNLKDIAENAEISVNAVRQALVDLQGLGLIKREKRSDQNGGPPSLYRLSHPDAMLFSREA